MICISASRINADAPICKLVCAILGALFTGTISNSVKGPNEQYCNFSWNISSGGSWGCWLTLAGVVSEAKSCIPHALRVYPCSCSASCPTLPNVSQTSEVCFFGKVTHLLLGSWKKLCETVYAFDIFYSQVSGNTRYLPEVYVHDNK